MKEVDKILNIEPPLNLPMDINEEQWTKENIPELSNQLFKNAIPVFSM